MTTESPSAYSIAELENVLAEKFAHWVRDLDLTVAGSDASHVELIMHPSAKLEREGGIVSGQALMAAADTAMALLLISLLKRPCATVDMNTSFLRPAAGSDLSVRAEIVRLGRSLAFVRAALTAVDGGKLVATATATYAVAPPGKPGS